MGKLSQKLVQISIIIPVYNVYEWLDECMESVVNQTFPDFEVILINDGSTDGSDVKCEKWKRLDERIRVISKKNEGPSIARNCGIENAKGEYLVFIDADDWVAPTYLEKLFNAVVENHASFAECDIYKFNNDTNEKTYHICCGDMGCQYTLEQHIIYGNPAIWKCIIKRTLFIKNNIKFPNCHGEAKPVYILLLVLNKGIVNVHEGLYYYRRFRPGSLTAVPRINNGDEDAIGVKSADSLIQEFKRLGLYDKYKELLQKTIRLGFSDRLAGLFYRRNKNEFIQLAQKYYEYMEQRFPNAENFSYITFGGYNLNRILRHMNVLHNPYCRFNFSSIISLMHPIEEKLVLAHKNRYREIMLNREINNSFWNIIEEINPEYIFMDFIEERFDLLRYNKGYITKSDAFDKAEIKVNNYEVLERASDECMTLWKNSFEKFIEKLETKSPKCRIVVIESYLSEGFGDINGIDFFENIDEIRDINHILEEYYAFVAKNYKQISMIKASRCEYYYTDKNYEYGNVPSHLNEIVNRNIAKMLEKTIINHN